MKRSTPIVLLLALLCLFFAAFAQAEEQPVDFSDNFSDQDYASHGWVPFLVTGPENEDYVFPGPRRMSFHMPVTDAYLYQRNERTFAENSKVEATFQNVYSKNGSFAVTCRVTDAGWYEFRVNVSGDLIGTYALYRYDQALKDEGKNPYSTITLHPGVNEYPTTDLNLKTNDENTIALICQDDTFRVFINDVEQIPVKKQVFTDNYWFEGNSGFGVINSGDKGQIDCLNFEFTDLG